MRFENLFENDRKDYRNNRGNDYPDDSEYAYNSRNPFNRNRADVKWRNILEKIRNNKKLKIFVISAGILMLTLLTTLIVVLFPLIAKLFDYITQNGLQGVLNDITGFLDKILKGTAS
jgi:hypothetical protein